jgi:high-affinity iron transporter
MILKHIVLLAGATGLALGPASASAQTPESVARRIATVSAIAVEEYALGVANGHVISAAELEEARLFLAEAAKLADGLPPTVQAAAKARLERLRAAADRLDDAVALHAAVDTLRTLLAAGLGISLDPPPSRPVSLVRGAEVYARSCAACHGLAGAGDGPSASALDPRPSDFTDRAALAATSPLDFFRKVTVGVAGTAMAGFEAALSVEDRWAVSLYVAGLRYTEAERTEGRRWVTVHCPACLVELSDVAAALAATDDSLARLLAPRAGVPVPEAAVAFARTAGAVEVLGGDRGLAARRVAARVEGLISDAAAYARSGDRDAALSSALEAYLVFEGIEREVGARDAGAVASAERAFGTLRVALAEGDSAAIAMATAGTRRALAGAVAVLDASGSHAVLFGQSLLIILREGLEAILIIGALTGLLVQAGAVARVRDLGIGVGLAIVASLATAVLFATVLRVSVAQQEAIEGLTMLLAAVVLFWVASWMVSKIEAERWQAFVRHQLRAALASRSTFALVGIAFLAVYREGVETVLFYGALLGTVEGPTGAGAVLAGFVGGALVLAGIYLAMRRWGVRIPIRPFFAVTGVLLTIMAVSFAGRGVAELQVAGWVPTTPLRLPTLPALGVFPTVQTLGAQLLIATGFVIAVVWIARATATPPTPARSAPGR